MIRCDMCQKCVKLMSYDRVYCESIPGKKILRMQSQYCKEFEPVVYYDTVQTMTDIQKSIYYDSDSLQSKPSVPHCTILWASGETTYLKGKNALRIARSWLYSDPECLLVSTPGWIYLKGYKDMIHEGI